MKWAILLVFLIGCGFCAVGSGNRITEDRVVPPFHSVVIVGSANVYVTQDETNFVKVETDDNIMEMVETEVLGHVLYIRDTNCFSSDVDVYVTMDEIQTLSISGSGKYIGTNRLKGDNIVMKISGSGSFEAEVDAITLTSVISGSGKLNLKGKADFLDHRVAGSGNLNAYDLLGNVVKITITGSGDSQVNAKDKLDVRISGSGNVRYKGTPQVLFDGSGSSTVEAVE